MSPDALRAAEEKWERKTLKAFKEVWPSMVKKSDTYDAFVSGVSNFAGISESAVRNSIPADEYKKFQTNPEAYLDKAVRSISDAADKDKWSDGYVTAFGG